METLASVVQSWRRWFSVQLIFLYVFNESSNHHTCSPDSWSPVLVGCLGCWVIPNRELPFWRLMVGWLGCHHFYVWWFYVNVGSFVTGFQQSDGWVWRWNSTVSRLSLFQYNSHSFYARGIAHLSAQPGLFIASLHVYTCGPKYAHPSFAVHIW